MATLIGVLLGEAPTLAKAQRLVDIFQPCPYCVSCTGAGCTVIGVFALPAHHRQWLEAIAEQPEETLGLKRAQVFFTQRIEASSPWSRGEVQPNLERAPCGSDCRKCPRYPGECRGCPATVALGMIEKAHPDSAAEILAVINVSNRQAYKGVIPKQHFREPVLSLEELLGDFERMTFYVYKRAGEIVGVAALLVESEEMGRIRWVYILPGHQRQGVGTALVSHLERRAREMGLKRMRLLVAGQARWAINFYQRLGYKPVEKTERPWGLDVFLGKELGQDTTV